MLIHLKDITVLDIAHTYFRLLHKKTPQSQKGKLKQQRKELCL